MKNLKTFLITALILLAVPASAMTLWEFYDGNLPSIDERAETYNKYFDDEYRGTAEQNTNFLNALLDNQVDNDFFQPDNQEASPLITLGATLPSGVAVFQTSLQSAITTSATSMTLTQNSVRGGGTLSGYQCFTVDEGTSIAEYICGTVSGTAVTDLVRGVDPITATTTNNTLKFAHRRGAVVKITDFPILQIMRNQLNGMESIPNPLFYTGNLTMSSSTQLVTKKYVDDTNNSGASDADTGTKGLVEIATALEVASSTSVGGTGAYLAIPASQATSTPGNSTTLNVVVTKNNGKIDQGFLDLSEQFTFQKSIVGGVSSTTYSGSTVNIDWSLGQTAMVQLNQSTTITFSNVTAGTSIRVFMCQDGVGSRTVSSYPAGMRWQTGFAPTLTTGANKCDIMSFVTGSSTTSYFGATSANF